jgi:hypothetical protein
LVVAPGVAPAPAPAGSTSGPNVALQQHLTLGNKIISTAFQTRWGHLFGHLYATLDHLHNPLRPNWKSLCQPAVLPLTTDYWPSPLELRKDYSEYNHTLALVQNQNDYNNDMSALLEEMICQRQAQDYQHIVSDQVPTPKPGTVVFYFSLRNQIHTITWNRAQNIIDVRRHIHKRVLLDRAIVKFPYEYSLWSPHVRAFLRVRRDMEPSCDDPMWSNADNVLCDAHSSADLSDGLKYRRNHYAIIPTGIPAGKYPSHYALTQNTSPSDAAVRARLEAEWMRESAKRVASMKQFLILMLSERGDKIVQAAALAASVAANTTGKDPARVEREAAANAAAQATLNAAFDALGIEIDTKSDRLPFPLPPVKDDGDLEKDERDAAHVLETYENALGFAIADVPFCEQKIMLNKSNASNAAAAVPSDSLPSAPTRHEWFHLQYDRVYSPHCVYHMELKWLVATGMHVEAWLKNLAKKAETKFGLHFVKIPTNQPLRTADSFHVPVPLHVPDPHVLRLVEEYVIAHCGFVMDSELVGFGQQRTHLSTTRANTKPGAHTVFVLVLLFLCAHQWLSSVRARDGHVRAAQASSWLRVGEQPSTHRVAASKSKRTALPTHQPGQSHCTQHKGTRIRTQWESQLMFVCFACSLCAPPVCDSVDGDAAHRPRTHRRRRVAGRHEIESAVERSFFLSRLNLSF